VRAVLDPNVLISALLSPAGAPAQLVRRWLAGDFELVVCDELLAELTRALAYPKLRARVTAGDAASFVALLSGFAYLASDPPRTPARSADPNDDYLLALAEAEKAMLVSGDGHLLELAPKMPVSSARAFLDSLNTPSG